MVERGPAEPSEASTAPAPAEAPPEAPPTTDPPALEPTDFAVAAAQSAPGSDLPVPPAAPTAPLPPAPELPSVDVDFGDPVVPRAPAPYRPMLLTPVPGRVRRTTLRPGGPHGMPAPPETETAAAVLASLAPRAGRPLRASLPPALVEPNRIIEVLGSSVPASPLPSDTPDEADPNREPSSDPPLQSRAAGLPPQRKPRARTSPASNQLPKPTLATAGERPPEPAPVRAEEPARSDENSARSPSERPGDQERRRWWEELFSGDFLRAIPILSPAQLEREVRFVQKSLNLPKGSRVLDLACGAGQHAVELAARGYDVVGFDQSESQLSWAGELARERGQVVRFQHGDMRDLAYDGEFDGIYCWNTSFGYFEEDRNIDVARRMLRALKPGGRLLLDVVNRDHVFLGQPSQNWFEGDGCVCIDDVRADFIASRLRIKRTLMLTSGKNRECNYSLRVYSLHELGKLLHEVGFKILQATGRPEMPGVFFGPESPRVIVLASRPRAKPSEPPPGS
jgi:SAM-dependent methyltransferase